VEEAGGKALLLKDEPKVAVDDRTHDILPTGVGK